MKKQNLLNSFKNAFQGIKIIMKKERNFQIHLMGFFMNLGLIFLLALDTIEIVLILGVSFLVLITEIFNTVIERLCDIVQPNIDSRIGEIKDISAGTVLFGYYISDSSRDKYLWKIYF